MIKTRVIPVLLIKDGLLKKPVRFRNPRTVANPIAIARVFEARQVDELVLLDIGCDDGAKSVNPDIVSAIAEELTVPLSCGGGIRSLGTITKLIQAGAEKVVLNTCAEEYPQLITQGAERFGAQCIVVSIDAQREDEGQYRVFTHNGSRATSRDPVSWAREAAARGAGEILLNSIGHEGTMKGYDLDLIQRVSHGVDIPVVAVGGAGTVDHFPPAILQGGAAAVGAGSIYHFTRITPEMVKHRLRDAGIPVRL